MAVLCTLIVAAPLVAGNFATSSTTLPVDSAFTVFSAVGMPIMLLLAALAYLPFSWREWTRPVAIGDVPGMVPAVLLFVIWASLSNLHTPALNLSVNAVAVLMAVSISASLISRLTRDRNALLAVLLSITVAATVVAAIAIYEYLEHLQLHDPQHRSFATFVDPNFLAGYLLMTIPIALSLFACAKDLRLRLICGLSVVMQSSALWLSGSRAGSAIVFVVIAAFLGLAAFTLSGSPRRRTSWKWIMVGVVLFVFGSVPALTPLLSRLSSHAGPQQTTKPAPGAGVTSSDAQVNSNEFRRWTWIGTVRMAQANPVLGTGIGAYELSYPRYEETAFTVHAHNSYLQLMAETGYPGVLLLLLALASVTAFAAHSLMLTRMRAANEARARSENLDDADDSFHSMVHSPQLLLAGLMAALIGTMLHNLIDSDWYVVANAVTLGAIIALIVAVSRDIAPLSTRRPAPQRKEMLAAGAVVAVLLLIRGAQLTSSRMNEALGESDFLIASSNQPASEAMRVNLTQAAEAYRAAAAADPLDPEPHLALAQIAATPQDRLRELNAAIAISRTGKAYYRLGQYYMASGETTSAITAFEHARDLEPKMLQNLHALASAYLAGDKTEDAERTLQTAAALQLTPYGQVRAMHESVETEFAYAHAMLGDITAKREDWQAAAGQYEKSQEVLSEYWTGRHYLVNEQGRTESKRTELADLYERVLKQLQVAYTRLQRPADAAAAGAKLETIRSDRAADELNRKKDDNPA